MPIFVGNLVVTHTDQVPEVEEPVESVETVESVEPTSFPAQLVSEGVAAHPREAVLIVNGKQKRIGRKSQYLVDMLSLEE